MVVQTVGCVVHLTLMLVAVLFSLTLVVAGHMGAVETMKINMD